MSAAALIKNYFDKNYRLVFWPQVGDAKGPQGAAAKGWTQKTYTIADYSDGYRVGIVTGHEHETGKFLHDVDIDWAPGAIIATKLLPPTEFVFGRASKRISHCFYCLPEANRSFKYEDIDKSTLIELRGAKVDGDLGLQTMVPPSVWTKAGVREELVFIKQGDPAYIETSAALKQRVCLAAISMLLAKHFGTNGFGHEPRMSWAGFMLRAGIGIEDIITMGEAISLYCNNLEVNDVRLVVESTAQRMANKEQKIKGGPSLAKLLGTQGKAIITRINEWLGRDSDFIRNADGSIFKDHQENIRRALVQVGVDLSYDAFSDKLLVQRGDTKTPMDDHVVNDLWFKIDTECRFRPTFAFFEKVLTHTAWSNAFHPVKDYFSTLEWDGKERIETFLINYGGADDNEYCRTVSCIFFVAAVRRVLQPGCKYDEMLVLESEQGLEKSSALRALCPHPDWFSDDFPLNVGAKEIIEATAGKWIIEASDLSGKRKTEVEALKSMLSRQKDGPARMAYGHFAIERPRHFVLVGTTNAVAYLNDPTGARRFWSFAVSRMNVGAIIQDRDQLWAEAVAREATGYSIRLPQHLWAFAAEEQEKRREVDSWEDLVVDYLENVTPDSLGQLHIAASTVWDILGVEAARRDRAGGLRITEIMQKLGFRRATVRLEGKVARGFIGRPTMLPLT